MLVIYGGAKHKGLQPRSATSPYLLSGILKCGVCGANLIIVTGYSSYGNYPKYGCSQHFNRGACSNSVMVRRDWVEERLLDDLQNQVLKREAIEYVLDEFGAHVKNAFANLSNQMALMRERKQKLEGELRRLASTAGETGPSAFLMEAIHEREQQLRQITDQPLAGGADSVDAHLSDFRKFVTQRWVTCTRSWRAIPCWPRKSFSSMFLKFEWLRRAEREGRIMSRRVGGICLEMRKIAPFLSMQYLRKFGWLRG